jgi:hypothetical protein
MKKIILLFLLFTSSFLNAQNTFEKVIDTLGSNTGVCIQQTFDGGYIYCGQSSYGGNDLLVVKIDSIGSIEWARTYSGPGMEVADYIEQTLDSGYIVNGAYDIGLNTKNWLLKLDVNGDTLWTQTFAVGVGATNVAVNNSMVSINNTIYGSTGNYRPVPITNLSGYLITSTGNGLPLASKIYNPSIYGSELRSIDKTFDDGFIMAGVQGNSGFKADVYLIRTNTFGDTLWTKQYDLSQTDAAYDVKHTTDSGFILVGLAYISFVNNIWLIKIDNAGDTLWTKFYNSPFTHTPYSIEQTIDGGYIITGDAMNSANERNLYLIKTNAVGDTLWTRTFNASINCTGLFVRQTKDGGFIISGVSQEPPVGTYIIKTDSMGNVASSTGLAEVNNPFVFSVYPNPSSGIFTLQVKGFPKTIAAIEVYNLTNECVYACNINNNETEQINLSHLPNGIYAVRLRTKNKIASQKIIIQK